MRSAGIAPARLLRDVVRSLRRRLLAFRDGLGGRAGYHAASVSRQRGFDQAPQLPDDRRLLRGEIGPLPGIGGYVIKLIMQRWHERVMQRAHVVNELPAALDDRDRAGLERGETRILLEIHAEDGAI